MRKTWFTWVIAITAVLSIFFAFNYHGGKDAVPLSEIFPDEEAFPVDVEYEFVEDETTGQVVVEKAKEIAAVAKKEEAATVAAVKKAAVEVPSIPAVRKDFNYTVQIASFKNQKKAEEALARIRKKVPSAFISSQDLGAKGVWYRIYAGQFNQRSEAEVTLNDIKRNFDSSFIISPKKAK